MLLHFKPSILLEYFIGFVLFQNGIFEGFATISKLMVVFHLLVGSESSVEQCSQKWKQTVSYSPRRCWHYGQNSAYVLWCIEKGQCHVFLLFDVQKEPDHLDMWRSFPLCLFPPLCLPWYAKMNPMGFYTTVTTTAWCRKCVIWIDTLISRYKRRCKIFQVIVKFLFKSLGMNKKIYE